MTAPSRVLAPRRTTRFRPPRFGLGGSRLGDPLATAGDATADDATADDATASAGDATTTADDATDNEGDAAATADDATTTAGDATVNEGDVTTTARCDPAVAVEGDATVAAEGGRAATVDAAAIAEGDRAAIATVDAAYTAGIRFFDTSPAYGDGRSERRLGSALAGRPRSGFLLSTKVAAGLPADGVRDSLAGSFERLGVTSLDLVFLQDPGDQPIDAAYAVLAEFRERGAIGAVGVAGRDWRQLDPLVRDFALDVVLLAGQYSLLDRVGLPLLNRCQARGVAAVVSGVLTPEVLLSDRSEQTTDPRTIRARRISVICEQYGVSLPQAALAFPGRHSAVTSVLIGAGSPAEIRADAALVRQPVPDQFWRDPELARLLGD